MVSRQRRRVEGQGSTASKRERTAIGLSGTAALRATLMMVMVVMRGERYRISGIVGASHDRDMPITRRPHESDRHQRAQRKCQHRHSRREAQPLAPCLQLGIPPGTLSFMSLPSVEIR